ncbi:MAG: hypothetical protein Q4A78_06730 [Peptostreptococcaceae bacterium]|nr:hypothetical protein [Peptostreptococcaceae bacterium]
MIQHSMKLQMKRFTAVFLLVLILLSGCNLLGSPPENTVKNFEKGMNNLDIDKIFSCFEPSKAKQMESMFSIGNSISQMITGVNIDPKVLLNLFPLFSFGEEELGWPTWTFHDFDVKEDSDEAIIDCKVDVSYSNGEVEYYTARFYMIRVDGKWYINKLE